MESMTRGHGWRFLDMGRKVERSLHMIGLIRAYDTNTIPLVAGLDWAYDLTPLKIDELVAAARPNSFLDRREGVERPRTARKEPRKPDA